MEPTLSKRQRIQGDPMRPFKIGVIADCFKLGPRAGVKKAKSMGADGVQIWAVSGEMSPERMNRAARHEFRKFCEGLGIEISALCGDLGGHGFQRADRNPLKVARSMRIVDLAADLGTKVVTTHIGVVPEDTRSEVYQAMLTACRELGAYAVKKGVCFAIETGPERATVLRGFLDEVGSKGIGVNLDPANLIMVLNDDPVAAVDTLSSYIVHTHAKDGVQLAPCDPVEVYNAFAEGGVEGFDFGTLFSEEPLGRGKVEWDAYLDALERIGYRGYLTIEREVGDNPGRDIEDAVRFLNGKLGRPTDPARRGSTRRRGAVAKEAKPVRVGIVGLGFMGRTHFNSYAAIPNAEVVALADVDKGKRAGGFLEAAGNIGTGGNVAVDLSGIKVFDKADALIADDDVDVVDITLPTFLHAEYAIKALEAGKHVICEKPMAHDSKAAKKMIDAAKKAKRRLFIAHCLRFWP
jgi:sugar phosphate isomerase/epimerase